MDRNFKITVMADTHGNVAAIQKLLPVINEGDFIIHLGDTISDIVPFKHLIKSRLICVRGNCDKYYSVPEDMVIKIGEAKFFLTHGHRYNVKSSLYDLSMAAQNNDCEYALFGHTHVPTNTPLNKVQMINPGSLAYANVGYPSYAIIVGNGKTFISKNIII